MVVCCVVCVRVRARLCVCVRATRGAHVACVCVSVYVCVRALLHCVRCQVHFVRGCLWEDRILVALGGLAFRSNVCAAMSDQEIQAACRRTVADVIVNFRSFAWSELRARRRLIDAPPTSFERDMHAAEEEAIEQGHEEMRRGRSAAARGARQPTAAARGVRQPTAAARGAWQPTAARQRSMAADSSTPATAHRERSRSRDRLRRDVWERMREEYRETWPRPPAPFSEAAIAFRAGFAAALAQANEALVTVEDATREDQAAALPADVVGFAELTMVDRALDERTLHGFTPPMHAADAFLDARIRRVNVAAAQRQYFEERLALLGACRSVVRGEFLQTRCIGCRDCGCVQEQVDMVSRCSMTQLYNGDWRHINTQLGPPGPAAMQVLHGPQRADPEAAANPRLTLDP